MDGQWENIASEIKYTSYSDRWLSYESSKPKYNEKCSWKSWDQYNQDKPKWREFNNSSQEEKWREFGQCEDFHEDQKRKYDWQDFSKYSSNEQKDCQLRDIRRNWTDRNDFGRFRREIINPEGCDTECVTGKEVLAADSWRRMDFSYFRDDSLHTVSNGWWKSSPMLKNADRNRSEDNTKEFSSLWGKIPNSNECGKISDRSKTNEAIKNRKGASFLSGIDGMTLKAPESTCSVLCFCQSFFLLI